MNKKGKGETGMLPASENTQIELLNVITYEDWYADLKRQGGRGFCILSYRFDAVGTRICTGEREIPIEAGEIAFFPADFGYRRKTEHDRLIALHFFAPGLSDEEFHIFPERVSAPLATLFTRARKIWSARGDGYRWRAQALLCEILSYLHFETVERPLSPQVARALEEMRDRYADPDFSVASLSDATMVSGTYLRRLFRREQGMTPKQVLDGIRFSHAQALLNTGLLTVSEVAEACGFRDPKNFATAFRNKFGYAPTEQTYGKRPEPAHKKFTPEDPR